MIFSLIILTICFVLVGISRKLDSKNAFQVGLGVSLLGLVGNRLLERVVEWMRLTICPTGSTSDTLRTVTLVFSTV
jgi:hypothetical protein